MNINEILANVLISVIILGASYITNYVNTKTKQMKEKYKNELLNKYIEQFNALVGASVKSVTQTYVDTLKKENAFTAEAQVNALFKAREQVMKLANENMLNAVQAVYSDVNVYLTSQIEKQVYQLKSE